MYSLLILVLVILGRTRGHNLLLFLLGQISYKTVLLLSKRKQDTSHRFYFLAGNLILISMICLCLATFCVCEG